MLAVVLTGGLYALAGLGKAGNLPANIGPFLAIIFGLLLVAHLAMRRLAPNADPILLADGRAAQRDRLRVHRPPLHPRGPPAGGVDRTRDRRLRRHPGCWCAGPGTSSATATPSPSSASACSLLPLVPGIGEDINGARLWIHVGSLNFQPGEIAKLALAIFFASVLVERADLLSQATRRVGRFLVLDPRYLAPILAAWGLSLVIFLSENDLGSSFLFFALFIGMLWVATGRAYYLGLGAGLFAFGSFLVLKVIGHAKTRVQGWLEPVAPCLHVRATRSSRAGSPSPPAGCSARARGRATPATSPKRPPT